MALFPIHCLSGSRGRRGCLNFPKITGELARREGLVRGRVGGVWECGRFGESVVLAWACLLTACGKVLQVLVSVDIWSHRLCSAPHLLCLVILLFLFLFLFHCANGYETIGFSGKSVSILFCIFACKI